MTGRSLWHGLKNFELSQVMSQSNVMFTKALTKIGQLIESRFITKKKWKENVQTLYNFFYLMW